MTTQAITNLSCAKFSNSATYLIAKRLFAHMTAFQRGAKAASMLGRQRELLASMRHCLSVGATDRAQTYYAEWKRIRAEYLVLIGWY